MKFYTMQTIIRPEVMPFDLKTQAAMELARDVVVKILEENVVETTETVDGEKVTKLTCNVVIATPEELEAKIHKLAKLYYSNCLGPQFSSVSDVRED